MIPETPMLQKKVSQGEERYTTLVKNEFIKHAKEINRLNKKLEEVDGYVNTDLYNKGEIEDLIARELADFHPPINIPLRTSDLINDSGFLSNVTWEDVESKPYTFPPSTHSHTWDSIIDKPATYPPSTHYHNQYLTQVTWDQILDKPTSFPTYAHFHNWNSITNKPNFATVATSGSYNDLSNTPYIPTKTSDLTNDSGYITGVAWNDVTSKPIFATVATSGSYTDLSNTPTIPTKVSDLTNDSGFITGVSWNDVSSKPTFAAVATSGDYADLINTPNITNPDWSDIQNKPSTFPPESHTHSYLPLTGGTLTGNETISKSAPIFTLRDTVIARNAAPSSNYAEVEVEGLDKNNARTWGLYHKYNTDKSNQINLIAYKGTTTDYTWSGIGVGFDSSGNEFTYAPTPASGDNSTKIATTAFVNTKAGNYLPLSGGTMTGMLNMNSQAINFGTNYQSDGRIYNMNNYLRLVGGNNTSTGSWIDIGSTSSSVKGISLNASNGSGTTKELRAVYDGTLTWGGTAISLSGHTHSYLPLSGGTLTGTLNSKRINYKYDFSKGTTPSSTVYGAMYFADKDGDGYGANCLGLVENRIDANNVVSTYIRALRNQASSNTNCEISVNVDNNGNTYTSAPTPATSDNSTKIATTAWVRTYATPSNIGAATSSHTHSYLPLGGGTMTGTITRSGWVVKNSADNSYIEFLAGTDETSSYISIYGKNHSSNAGIINLRAYDGTNSRYLQLKPDGTLTWGGTAISLNGHTHSYLPLAGGTMTGVIKRNGDVITATADDQYTRFSGGSAHDKGAALTLGGKDHSWAGKFNLKAVDASRTKILEGKPDGTLTWDGKNVLTNGTVGTIVSKANTTATSIAATTGKNLTSISLAAGKWVVTGHAKYSDTTANKNYGISITTTSARYNYNDDGTVWYDTGGTYISLQTTKILELSATTTVYLTAYANTACTMDRADMYAIRIV